MSDIDLEDINETETSSVEDTDVEETDVDEQDPIQQELDRVKQPKTELEKATFSLKKNADRVRELGLDPEEVLGVKKKVEVTDEDDDQPMTRGEWKKIEAQRSQKTALDLTNDIQDEAERELTKFHLENTIKSTGNPQEDLKNARAIVNSVKNQQVAEIATTKVPAKNHSSSSGAPARRVETKNEELTPQELAFTKAPFNMSREEVVKLRKQ